MANQEQDNGHRNTAGHPGRPRQRERPALSVVIPAYNEAHRLLPTLKRIRDYMVATGTRCELIIVNDGSQDQTADVIMGRLAPSPLPLSVLILENAENRGYSVREGMQSASGKLMLMCDADLSTPIEELDKLRHWIDAGYDVVIGSRDQPDSILDPPQPLLRRWMAWVLRAIRRRLLLPELQDTQCGFKLFRDVAAMDVFARQTIDGWLFDCEVLGLADRLGYRIKEVGVVWRNDPDSRVNPLREALTAIPTLLTIRRRLRAMARTPR